MGMQITLNLKGNVLVHLILLNYVRVCMTMTQPFTSTERERGKKRYGNKKEKIENFLPSIII